MPDLPREQGFLDGVIGDGRPAVAVLALGLIVSGVIALFLAATGHFLPHDEQFLGLTAEQLCGEFDGRVVDFMVHDRAAFGGVLIAIGVMYLWLATFPLAYGQAWAWWTLLVSGSVGFASFLSYAGTGYLDSWHAAATVTILPGFILGLIRTRRIAPTPGSAPSWRGIRGLGRACLLWASLGGLGAGLVILTVGMTSVFVPQDLDFLRASRGELDALSPRLVPLIAHDRAGFGGALVSAGVVTAACCYFAPPSRSLLQALTLAGLAGFGPAIGVHFAIGYTDPLHLAPAVLGAALYTFGLLLSTRPTTPEPT